MAASITVEDGTRVDGANSYFDEDELDAYYEAHLYPPTFTSTEHKTKASIQACRMLDASVHLKGALVAWDQAMAWPRFGVKLPGEPIPYASVVSAENVHTSSYNEVPSNKVPKAYKEAAMELVRFIVAKDRDSQLDKPAVIREKVDVIERQFTEAGNAIDLLPEIVQRMVKPFVLGTDDSGGAGAGGPAPASSVTMVRA